MTASNPSGKWNGSLALPCLNPSPSSPPRVNGIQHLCAWGWTQKWTFKGEKGKPGLRALPTSMTMVFRFCYMSSVRSTSDGRGPVTRKRVPDREEQGKPSKDARRGRCHTLESLYGPCGWHRYRALPVTSHKSRIRKKHVKWSHHTVWSDNFQQMDVWSHQQCPDHTLKFLITPSNFLSHP